MDRNKRKLGKGLEHLQREYTRPCYECGLRTQQLFQVIHVYLPLCSNCTRLANRPSSEFLSKAIKEGLNKARKKGQILGAPSIYDDDEIYEAYKRLGTVRATAKEIGCSVGKAGEVIKRLRELEELDKE